MKAAWLETNVLIRPLMLSDVPAIYAAVDESRAELRPWMPWCTPAYDEAAVAAYVENSALDRQVGRAFEFGIFAFDGEFVGNCGLNSVNAENRLANLGYWIRTSRTRRGFATSAVQELAQWGFSNTATRPLRNHRSRRKHCEPARRRTSRRDPRRNPAKASRARRPLARRCRLQHRAPGIALLDVVAGDRRRSTKRKRAPLFRRRALRGAR